MRPHLGAPRSSHPHHGRGDIILEESAQNQKKMRAMDRINGMSRAEAVAAFRACCGSTKYAEVAGVRFARHVSESIWAGCASAELTLVCTRFRTRRAWRHHCPSRAQII